MFFRLIFVLPVLAMSSNAPAQRNQPTDSIQELEGLDGVPHKTNSAQVRHRVSEHDAKAAANNGPNDETWSRPTTGFFSRTFVTVYRGRLVRDIFATREYNAVSGTAGVDRCTADIPAMAATLIQRYPGLTQVSRAWNSIGFVQEGSRRGVSLYCGMQTADTGQLILGYSASTDEAQQIDRAVAAQAEIDERDRAQRQHEQEQERIRRDRARLEQEGFRPDVLQ